MAGVGRCWEARSKKGVGWEGWPCKYISLSLVSCPSLPAPRQCAASLPNHCRAHAPSTGLVMWIPSCTPALAQEPVLAHIARTRGFASSTPRLVFWESLSGATQDYLGKRRLPISIVGPSTLHAGTFRYRMGGSICQSQTKWWIRCRSFGRQNWAQGGERERREGERVAGVHGKDFARQH